MLKISWFFVVLVAVLGCHSSSDHSEFQSGWQTIPNQTWIGPDFWANRLQDWQIINGRLECLSEDLPMRTVHITTRRLSEDTGHFRTSVLLGAIDFSEKFSEDAASGFLIGAGAHLDYRAAAIIHHSPGPSGGLFCGINGRGCLFIRDFSDSNRVLKKQVKGSGYPHNVKLMVAIHPSGDKYSLEISASGLKKGAEPSRLEMRNMDAQRFIGNLALVSHAGKGEGGRFWFQNWEMTGDKLKAYPHRHCGPVLSSQYTLSKGILKLTAQLMPLAEEISHKVIFQIKNGNRWKTLAQAPIHPEGYTATFRVTDWNAAQDTPYRLLYDLPGNHGNPQSYKWGGMIRHDPLEKENIVVAAFTGNHNVTRSVKWHGVDGGYFPWNWGLWFPHEQLVAHVNSQKPDILFFSGDQVYEGASPTVADFKYVWKDYLYKWYLWCWAFRDLTATIPAIIIPDDHDVYHGNVWGCGGKATQKGLRGARAQDSGGYKMTPAWVNMVQRTQTSHLPDPFDAEPVLQGINVYYTDVLWGGVSFAVLEDRKFKSAPKPLLPQARVWNGWASNPDFKIKTEADAPGACLLGDRQLNFLETWAADWSGGTWMKAVLSQTIFANVATLPRGSLNGSVIPSLNILPEGEYAADDTPVSDMDSNGWPQTGRNQAVRTIRKGFAVHIAGDQHLGSTIQYGVDDWGDAGYALCTPSIANFWPRRWYPSEPGANRRQGMPLYSGDFEDGFGNKMTVFAVSNPHTCSYKPRALHNLAPGYGIVRFHKQSRKIVFENWPIWSNPARNGKPYPGWPVIASQLENYGRKAVAWLPRLKVEGLSNPVVQVVDVSNGEIVYTLRIEGSEFRPGVFHQGAYTVHIGEPGTEHMQRLENVSTIDSDNGAVIRVQFPDRRLD